MLEQNSFEGMEVQPRPSRKRDELWDAMEMMFGHVAEGTNAHKKRNKATSDLRKNGATADSARRAYAAYGARFSVCCTDSALATHYPLLVQPEDAQDRKAWARKQELQQRFV